MLRFDSTTALWLLTETSESCRKIAKPLDPGSGMCFDPGTFYEVPPCADVE